ncbi:hypothetical protein Rleg10DRAFT_6398 [Rhizobium leguminosarum bv. trifolii WSM2012]|nr:hypothetical protein Rleg10DRAFT_6398 [Rhizobium leguminosarum bv. trifolii WSM2012]
MPASARFGITGVSETPVIACGPPPLDRPTVSFCACRSGPHPDFGGFGIPDQAGVMNILTAQAQVGGRWITVPVRNDYGFADRSNFAPLLRAVIFIGEAGGGNCRVTKLTKRGRPTAFAGRRTTPGSAASASRIRPAS